MPEHFSLEEFRTKRFDYKAGEHLSLIGPTSISGKTTTGFALLEAVLGWYPEIQPTVLVMKHRDRIVASWTKRLGFREVPSWPPEKKFSEMKPFGSPPPGYTLWPKQSLSDPEGDNERLQREFVKAITHNRQHAPSISFADEIYGLIAELSRSKDRAGNHMVPMRTLLTAVVTRDSIAGHGLWFASQKPSGTQGVSMPGFLYNSPEHLLLAKDGEERNRKRYSEIACGIDPAIIEAETLKLDKYSWLYIKRSGPEMCIIDAYDPSLAM